MRLFLVLRELSGHDIARPNGVEECHRVAIERADNKMHDRIDLIVNRLTLRRFFLPSFLHWELF